MREKVAMKDKIKESNKTDRKELQRSSHGRET